MATEVMEQKLHESNLSSSHSLNSTPLTSNSETDLTSTPPTENVPLSSSSADETEKEATEATPPKHPSPPPPTITSEPVKADTELLPTIDETPKEVDEDETVIFTLSVGGTGTADETATIKESTPPSSIQKDVIDIDDVESIDDEEETGYYANENSNTDTDDEDENVKDADEEDEDVEEDEDDEDDDDGEYISAGEKSVVIEDDKSEEEEDFDDEDEEEEEDDDDDDDDDNIRDKSDNDEVTEIIDSDSDIDESINEKFFPKINSSPPNSDDGDDKNHVKLTIERQKREQQRKKPINRTQSKVVQRNLKFRWLPYIKKRSVKWLLNKMHVMESNKAVVTTPKCDMAANKEKPEAAIARRDSCAADDVKEQVSPTPKNDAKEGDPKSRPDDESLQQETPMEYDDVEMQVKETEVVIPMAQSPPVSNPISFVEQQQSELTSKSQLQQKPIIVVDRRVSEETVVVVGVGAATTKAGGGGEDDVKCMNDTVILNFSTEPIQLENDLGKKLATEPSTNSVNNILLTNAKKLTEELKTQVAALPENSNNATKLSSVAPAANSIVIMESENSILKSKLNEPKVEKALKEDIISANDEDSRDIRLSAIKRPPSPAAMPIETSNSKRACTTGSTVAQDAFNAAIAAASSKAAPEEQVDVIPNDTTGNQIGKYINHLEDEINSLDEILKAKEEEWNNILHSKKVKEEFLERLKRRQRHNDLLAQPIFNADQQKAHEIKSSSLPLASNVADTIDLSSRSTSSLSMSSTTQSILQNRANMKSSDLQRVKFDPYKLKKHFLRNFATNNSYQDENNQSRKTFSIGQQQVQQLQNDYLNGSQTAAMGRQGAIKDVQSIIADYRQKHPEQVPRRGRRLRPYGASSLPPSNDFANADNCNSRPSSADSNQSNSNNTTNHVATSTPSQQQKSHDQLQREQLARQVMSVSFRDALSKYAKLTPSERQRPPQNNILADLNNRSSNVQPPYPEVTLHPLNAHPVQTFGSNSSSLLHGILTKNTSRSLAYNSLSPTLARLLTAPERKTPQATGSQSMYDQHLLASSENPLAKNQDEITITPVMNSIKKHKRELEAARAGLGGGGGVGGGELNRLGGAKLTKYMDDEAEDSVDRLVIDEDSPMDLQSSAAAENEQNANENDVPECQGCEKREAQFVCAGCGNQWYCSRECQVRAWDEHSEVCTG